MLNLLLERLFVIDPPELAHTRANLAVVGGRDHGNAKPASGGPPYVADTDGCGHPEKALENGRRQVP